MRLEASDYLITYINRLRHNSQLYMRPTNLEIINSTYSPKLGYSFYLRLETSITKPQP